MRVKMAAANILVYMITESLVSLIGVLASTFIVVVNLLECTKSRSLNTCDLILVALSISSSCFQCTLLPHTVVRLILKDDSLLDNAVPVLYQLLFWFGSCSFWFTACLCIFYCVKIVDFKHSFFFWLKSRIAKAIPWLLLSSVVWSLGFSLPVYWDSSANIYQQSTNFTGSSTITEGNFVTAYFVISNFLCFCLPLLLDIASITLILISLYRHTRRMRENTSGFSQPRMEAHFGAARMVVSLLLIYTLFVMANCVIVCFPHLWLGSVLGAIIFSVLPAQSIILTMGTPKLRRALWKLLSLKASSTKSGTHPVKSSVDFG